MARKEITVRCFISIDGADPVPLNSLAPEELDKARKKMVKNFARGLSDYYSQHPEEYAAVPEITKYNEERLIC